MAENKNAIELYAKGDVVVSLDPSEALEGILEVIFTPKTFHDVFKVKVNNPQGELFEVLSTLTRQFLSKNGSKENKETS